MCEICGIQNKTDRSYGLYEECGNCGTWLIRELPTNDYSQRIIEEHADSFILGEHEFFDLNTYLKRLDEIKKYSKDTAKVLDFGCGNGNFVRFLISKGYDAFGYDKAEQIQKHLSHTKTPQFKRLSDIPDNSFDVITCFDVIEHTTDPYKIMSHLDKKLKKGGILYITTPNSQGISARILKDHWWVFGPEAHFIVFSMESLRYLLKKAKFKEIQISTNTITPWFTPMERFINRVFNKIIYLSISPFRDLLFRKFMGDNLEIIATK